MFEVFNFMIPYVCYAFVKLRKLNLIQLALLALHQKFRLFN